MKFHLADLIFHVLRTALHIFFPLCCTLSFFGQNSKKWQCQKNLFQNRSRMFQNILSPKISKSKKCCRVNFFPWNCFSAKMAKVMENWHLKIYGWKFFWSESTQNVSKCILNRISRNPKTFPLQKFFTWSLSFFGQNSIKRTMSKNFGRKIFFGRNRFRIFQNVFWNENLEIEKFFPCKISYFGLCCFWPK